MTNDAVGEMFGQLAIKHIEDISEEYGKLIDWFEKDFPEGTIRLEVNADQRYGVLKYKLTVMSGKEATPRNQRLLTNTVEIDNKKISNIVWIEDFKKNLYEVFKAGS